MGVHAQAGHGRGEILDHVDSDGRAAEAGLDDVGPGERRRLRLGGQQHPGQGRQSVRRHQRPEGQLVHAEGGTRHGRARVADAGQVQGRLQGPVLARPPVAAHQCGLELQDPGPSETPPGLGEPAAGGRDELQLLRPTGDALEERLRLEVGVDLVPVARLGPEQGPDGRARPPGPTGQASGGLQSGQHTDVVLGRWTSEDHGYFGHVGLTPPIGD